MSEQEPLTMHEQEARRRAIDDAVRAINDERDAQLLLSQRGIYRTRGSTAEQMQQASAVAAVLARLAEKVRGLA